MSSTADFASGLAFVVVGKKAVEKLEELDDPVHPVKSALLEAVVKSSVYSIAMMASYPLHVAKINMLLN